MLAVILLQVIVLFLKFLKDKQKGTVAFLLFGGIFFWDWFQENHQENCSHYSHSRCKKHGLIDVIHQVKISFCFRQGHLSRVDGQLNDVGKIVRRNQAMGNVLAQRSKQHDYEGNYHSRKQALKKCHPTTIGFSLFLPKCYCINKYSQRGIQEGVGSMLLDEAIVPAQIFLQSHPGKARKEEEDAPFYFNAELFHSQLGKVWWKNGINYKKAQTFWPFGG